MITLQERVDKCEANAHALYPVMTTCENEWSGLVLDLNTERLRLEAENKRLNRMMDEEHGSC